tara:strand:- start:2832 stop:3779 length:948 start_codon:yes stop_codon:yes gene_type:complete
MANDQLLVDSASRIFADYSGKAVVERSESGEYPTALDEVLAQNGFFDLATRDSGFPLESTFLVLREAGKYAVSVPLAEIMLGSRWVGSGSRPSIGVIAGQKIVGIPWASRAAILIGVKKDAREALTITHGKIRPGRNIAGESRDEVSIENNMALDLEGDVGYDLLALARLTQTVGVLEKILELTLSYANEREQFGRPIAKFQAIQHNLAILAGEVAAAVRAGDSGIAAISSPRQRVEIASSKARVNEAAGTVAEIAHQVHGAMGFTHEHQLHHFTRRAWAWRDEFGNEVYWRQELGRYIAALGPENAWDFFATRG